MRYSIQLKLYQTEKFFGPGMEQLLSLVEETGSLRMSASRMNMAYSKAWRMIKTAESELGFALLHSTTGGKNGGGAKITKQGKQFLEKYVDFEHKLQQYAEVLFHEHFPDK